MADTSIKDETVAPKAPSNETGNVATPPVVTGNADVEAAKREAEAARLRANQLQNELDKVKQAQAEADRQKLEENEEWKTLAEKSQADLKELRETQDREARQTALKAATDNVLADYPAEVADIAKTTGLSLSDDSEAAQSALKEKLDSIKAKVAPGKGVGSNPSGTAVASGEEPTSLGRPRTIGTADQDTGVADNSQAKKHEYFGSLNAVKEMRRAAGLKVD